MVKKLLWLVPLLLGGAVVLTGAWPGSFTPSPGAPRSLFVPQPLALDGAWHSGAINSQQLLEKAIEVLAVNRTGWLKTKIRQTMTDAESTYAAEGSLQRGPNHCARLDMQVRTNGLASHMLVVSDGELLAQEITIPGTTPKVTSTRLPGAPADAPAGAEAAIREAYLAARGCGGPLALLRQLQPCLQNPKLQTGLLQGQAVILIKGEIDSEKLRRQALRAVPINYCYLFLDAKTLWPERVEWWGLDRRRSLRCVLQIDFHDHELNQELPLEQCVRAFSYRPTAAPAQ
jgi:hypothetical protein